MKKYIILSVNDNPKYLFHVPLVCWGWKKLGWHPFLFIHEPNRKEGDEGDYDIIDLSIIERTICPTFWLPDINPYKSETIAQVSRLYAASLIKSDSYLMTSDIDMLPLSNYWQPDVDKITVYGRDLTDYHYPICYIGAKAPVWHSLMDIKPLESYGEICSFDQSTASIDCDDLCREELRSYMRRDMRMQANMWTLDQDLITERINNSNFIPERIDRGTYKNGYPVGRVDRSAWTLNHKRFIDAHLPHDILTNDQSFKKVLQLLHEVWPKENWNWWVSYYKEFKKMMK